MKTCKDKTCCNKDKRLKQEEEWLKQEVITLRDTYMAPHINPANEKT